MENLLKKINGNFKFLIHKENDYKKWKQYLFKRIKKFFGYKKKNNKKKHELSLILFNKINKINIIINAEIKGDDLTEEEELILEDICMNKINKRFNSK